MAMEQNLAMLNGYLYEQLERLNDPDLDDEGIKREVVRGQAMSNLASKIIDNAELALKAQQFASDVLDANYELPKMLGVTKNGQIRKGAGPLE